MSDQTIRVIIADDHPAMRQGLELILASDVDINVVGTATNYETLCDVLQTTPADVLVLDLNGMTTTPYTMVVRIRRDFPDVRCVVFSSSIDLAPEVRRVGVLGYVVKDEMTSHLLSAIHAAFQHERYNSPLVHEYMGRSGVARRDLHIPPAELTALKFLAQGMTTDEVANAMKVKRHSAQNCITQLYRKTGCRNRTQLIEWYRSVFLPSQKYEQE